MEKEKCQVCQKEYDKELMIIMGSLLGDSNTYTCDSCFADVQETEQVGEGRTQAAFKKFNVVINEDETIEVLSTSKYKAFLIAQTLDEFNSVVLKSLELNEELHITVSPSERV